LTSVAILTAGIVGKEGAGFFLIQAKYLVQRNGVKLMKLTIEHSPADSFSSTHAILITIQAGCIYREEIQPLIFRH
jgi:hypothetical protein